MRRTYQQQQQNRGALIWQMRYCYTNELRALARKYGVCRGGKGWAEMTHLGVIWPMLLCIILPDCAMWALVSHAGTLGFDQVSLFIKQLYPGLVFCVYVLDF